MRALFTALSLRPTTATSVSAAALAACALFALTAAPLAGCSASPTAAPADAGAPPPGAVPLAAGGSLAVGGKDWTCALHAGALHCWGDNSFQRLHRANAGTGTYKPGPVDGAGGDAFAGVAQVRSGASSTCAVQGGRVFCWGASEFGQLGESGGPSGEPVGGASALDEVLEIATGGQFACARRRADVSCWGRNEYGQLTADFARAVDAGTSARPFAVASLAGVRHIAAGDAHACAVKSDGSVVCWGRNDFRQAGPDTGEQCSGRPCVSAPTAVPGLTDVRQLSLGGTHSCALDGAGRVHCWGQNARAQLGAAASPESCKEDGGGPAYPCSAGLVHVASMDGAVQISAGTDVTCATKDAHAWCWGSNDFGQLGRAQGGPAMSADPAEVRVPSKAPLGEVVEVATRGRYACALTATDAVHCWGSSPAGGLGVKATEAAFAVPVAF